MIRGSTRTTWIPNPATSKRSASENASIAYFDAWYAEAPGKVSLPPIEPTLTMRPRRSRRIPGRTRRHSSIGAKTFVSN